VGVGGEGGWGRHLRSAQSPKYKLHHGCYVQLPGGTESPPHLQVSKPWRIRTHNTWAWLLILVSTAARVRLYMSLPSSSTTTTYPICLHNNPFKLQADTTSFLRSSSGVHSASHAGPDGLIYGARNSSRTRQKYLGTACSNINPPRDQVVRSHRGMPRPTGLQAHSRSPGAS
jgi:hypothetical protein